MCRVRCLVDLMLVLQVSVVRACGLGQKTILSAVRKRSSDSSCCALCRVVWKLSRCASCRSEPRSPSRSMLKPVVLGKLTFLPAVEKCSPRSSRWSSCYPATENASFKKLVVRRLVDAIFTLRVDTCSSLRLRARKLSCQRDRSK